MWIGIWQAKSVVSSRVRLTVHTVQCTVQMYHFEQLPDNDLYWFFQSTLCLLCLPYSLNSSHFVCIVHVVLFIISSHVYLLCLFMCNYLHTLAVSTVLHAIHCTCKNSLAVINICTKYICVYCTHAYICCLHSLLYWHISDSSENLQLLSLSLVKEITNFLVVGIC